MFTFQILIKFSDQSSEYNLYKKFLKKCYVTRSEFRPELFLHKSTDCKQHSSLFIQSDVQEFGHFGSVLSHSSRCFGVWPKFHPPSLLLAGQRCLQGEPGPGESAYSSIKPQERASSARWKLLVNRSSGNWLAPAGRPRVWTQLSISPLHSSHHHTLNASIFSFIYWWLDKLFSLYLQSPDSLLIRNENAKHDMSGPPKLSDP